MKFGLWILIIALTAWSVDSRRLVPMASAALHTSTITHVNIQTVVTTVTAANGFIITSTEYRTATAFTTSTSTDGPRVTTASGTQTDTLCHTGGAQYQGGQWNYCNRSDPNQQRNVQDDNKNLNDEGANKSTALGMAAIAAGMALVAAGVALLPPPTTPMGVSLIAAGMALIAAGMAALAAAKKMNNNANKSGYNANKLDHLNDTYKSTISDGSGTSGTGTSQLGDYGNNDLGDGNSAGIKIDPALLRNGKMDSIFSDMEKKTGLNRDDVLNGLNSGQTPLSMLAASPSMKGKSAGSEANLQKMMDDANANGNQMTAGEVMDKLGLTDADLGTEVKLGGDASRAPASAETPNIDTLFPSKQQDLSGSTGGSPKMGLSPELQAALDKNGITGKTIFEMVHSQYRRRTPMMFGVPDRNKASPTAENPYDGLDI